MHSDTPPSSAKAPLRPTRHRVLLLLGEPRCPREIRERIPGSHRKQIETSLHRLAQDRLIECVTPNIRQSRLYRRTYLGNLLVHELTGEEPISWRINTDEEFAIRAYIQAGKYRRFVLRAMDPDREQTPKEIRKSVLPMYRRIGANHVHTVLRGFREHGIAEPDEHRRWSLTELGKTMLDIELDGLPERPTINRPLWEKIKLTDQEPSGQGTKEDKEDSGRRSV